MQLPNPRVEQFIARLNSIDTSLSPEVRRAMQPWLPFLRWATDPELSELSPLLSRSSDDWSVAECVRFSEISRLIAERMWVAGDIALPAAESVSAERPTQTAPADRADLPTHPSTHS